MRYRPPPYNDYMVMYGNVKIEVPRFSPYLTAPNHPAAYDVLASMITQCEANGKHH